ncbi:MAG: hypothetical protein F6J86_01035 [Symploca sp. SIO1B1]|nr:hypothetical protein [Symploca sp. SIO1C2]NER45243.1 hypothetical protein [Symploca sp. SIO1A3]NER92448.1 hypothetical protein [Symploca sp. SIO1B1]
MKKTFKKLSIFSSCLLAFSLISYSGLTAAEAESKVSRQAGTKGIHSTYTESLENSFLTKCKKDAVDNGLSQQEANKLCLCILKGSSAQGVTSAQLQAILDNPDADVPDGFDEVVGKCL